MAQETKKVNITIEAGANFQMYFTVRDDAERLIDLTGCTVEAQLREYAEASDYLEFTATHNGSGGRVSISMPFEDTAAIPYDSGVYDVYITDTNNIREKYLEGDVEIIPAVTKPVAGEIIYLLSFASEDDFPSYGMVRRLYFSHATNHMYRWNGTDYVDIVTDGEAATVEVGDVETLPAGSDATVENVGSLLNAVFDFGIPEGNGIASIEKTGTDVLTDTYTITFTDPSAEAFDFDVTNGKGIVSIAEVVSGLTHTFTVTFNDGDTFTYTLTDGNGIVSIEKTGATDNVDHYRITFDDGTYFDYNVTNVDTSEFYDKDEVDALLADKADVGDSYTKDEEDALLADKADSADLGDLATKDTVDWDTDIDDIPETFPPSAHNHDDRYYTETETDALLSAKADSSDVYTKTSVDTALALKANSADVYTKTATDALLLDKAPVIISSASGSIASFTDGSPAPVTALSVGIDPVQDLHGYDNPWPAGGGKNLLGVTAVTTTANGLTFTVNADGTVKVNGTATAAGTFPLCGYRTLAAYGMVANQTYILSGTPSGLGDNCYLMFGVEGTASPEYRDKGSGAEFQPSDLTIEYRAIIVYTYGTTLSNVVFQPMIRKSTEDASWAPYENICSITGWDEAVVTRTGKNLCPSTDWIQGQYSNGVWESVFNTRKTSPYISIKPNTTYTMSIDQNGTADLAWINFNYFDRNKNWLGSRIDNGDATFSGQRTKTFTIHNSNACFIRLTARAYSDSNKNIQNQDIATGTPQLELGSSASSYKPYQGTSVTIDLDGTRYGGVIDVLTGEMRVDRVIFERNTSAMNISETIPGWKNSGLKQYYGTNYTSSATIYGAFSNIFGLVDTSHRYCSYHPTNDQLYLNKALFSDKTQSEWIAEAIDVQIVCPLVLGSKDFRFTVQLTPSQMQTLLGENNVWADTGDVEVTYRADTKLFVQGQIAETLDSVKKAKQIITDVTTEMVAPRNLAEGDYVIVGDDLLKTTATVASGSTLTIDINCVKKTVAEALIALATASE